MELCASDELRVLETLLTGSADACSLWNSVTGADNEGNSVCGTNDADVLDALTAALPTRATCRGVANDTTAEDDDLLSGLQLDDTLLELSASGFDVPGSDAPDMHIGELDGVFDDSKVSNGQTASWFPTPEVDNTMATKVIAPVEPSSAKTDTIGIDGKEKRSAQVTGKKRNRVKDELEYLRAHVVELETILYSLQPETTTHDDSSSVETSTHPLGGMWKRVATRQREQKQRAEVENTRLRELLEGQLHIVRSLSKLLQKLPDLNWLESLQQHSSTVKMLSSPAPSVDVFDLLLQHLETLYPQLDTVMVESGLSHGPMAREIRSGQLKTDPHDRVFLEMIDCSVLPFDFHATGAAVWKYISLSALKVHNGIYHATDVTNDMIRAQYTVTLTLQRSELRIHMRLVGKRIIEQRRVAILWCAMGHSEGWFLGCNDQIRFRESCWTVVQPHSFDRGDANGEVQEASAIQAVVHMTPELKVSSSGEQSSNRVGILTDLVIASFRQNLSTFHQTVENILVMGDHAL